MSRIASGLPGNVQEKNGVHIVGDFMTPRKDLRVVKLTTTVDEGIACCMRRKASRVLVQFCRFFIF